MLTALAVPYARVEAQHSAAQAQHSAADRGIGGAVTQGGVYVPTLAHNLLTLPNKINFKGIAIGNPTFRQNGWNYPSDPGQPDPILSPREQVRYSQTSRGFLHDARISRAEFTAPRTLKCSK
jgi:hypothetical protein|eukprot:COSAG06_NODE_9374_length_1918_cov_1.090709_1_plen_122_part_00